MDQSGKLCPEIIIMDKMCTSCIEPIVPGAKSYCQIANISMLPRNKYVPDYDTVSIRHNLK